MTIACWEFLIQVLSQGQGVKSPETYFQAKCAIVNKRDRT